MRFKTIKNSARLFYELYGSYKRYLTILVILGLFGGLLESFGISILVPLFSHILDKPLAETNTISQLFTQLFNWLGVDLRLRYLLPLIAIIFIIRSIVLYVFEWIRASISYTYESTMRRDLYHKVLSAPWRYLIAQRIGFVENTVMIDIERTTKLLQDITNGVLQFSSLLVYVVIAVTINADVTIFTLLFGGTILFFFRPLLRHVQNYSHKMLNVNKSIAHDINESAIGLKTIKAIGGEGALKQQTTKLFERLKTLKVRQTLLKSAMTVSVQPASVVFIVIVFAYAFTQPSFDFAIFIVTVFLIQRIFIYIERTQSILHTMSVGIPYAQHVVQLRKELDNLKGGDVGGSKPFIFNKELKFSDVSFEYENREAVLKNISFSIPKGSFVAFAGLSGSGKTTIVDLMLRLLQPASGTITLDGTELSDIAQKKWTQKTGYVAQEVFLVNDTIEDNIRFYDNAISDADVRDAVEASHLSSLVERLPDGLQTRVGERGLNLSGGERQRIALARTLARKPELLILDEATSALDAEAEQAIKQALEELRGEITIVVVAHRFETIRSVDTVFVLRDGTLIENGSPQELLDDKNSFFFTLHG